MKRGRQTPWTRSQSRLRTDRKARTHNILSTQPQIHCFGKQNAHRISRAGDENPDLKIKYQEKGGIRGKKNVLPAAAAFVILLNTYRT